MIYTFGTNKRADQGNKAQNQANANQIAGATSNTGGGGKTADNQGNSGGIAGMSEELRDEHLNKRLNEAFTFKNLGGEENCESALQIYLEIINLDFLRDSKIDKHVFMKFNAYKNMGELYERLGLYFKAKQYYTMAIKIKERDAFIWTRLGMLEYTHLRNLPLAKQCLEVAVQCYSTIQKRSSQINPILMKIAEIAFSDYDFKTSERMVDSILQRVNTSSSYSQGQMMMQGGNANSLQSQSQGQEKDLKSDPELFAYLLKSYFLLNRGDEQLSKVMIEKAKRIHPQASYTDVDVIAKFQQSIQVNLNSKDIVVRTTGLDQRDDGSLQSQSQHSFVRQLNPLQIISIKPSMEQRGPLEYFDDFLYQLVTACEAQQNNVIQLATLDCESYFPIMNEFFADIKKGNIDQNLALKFQESLNQYYDKLAIKENKAMMTDGQIQGAGALNQSASNKSAQPVNATSRRGAANAQVNQTQQQRQLRKKPDATEQQLKQYILKPLKDFKEYIINDLVGIQAIQGSEASGQSNPSLYSDSDLEIIYSSQEILRARILLTQEASTINEDALANGRSSSLMGDQANSAALNLISSRLSSIGSDQTITLEGILQSISQIQDVVEKTQLRNVNYVLRNILRLFMESPLNAQLFLNFQNSSIMYRMFLQASNGELTKQNLDNLGSFQVALTLFELSLFNQEVKSHIKSGALINQRDRFFEYFAAKEFEYFTILDRETKRLFSQQDQPPPTSSPKVLRPIQVEILKIRFYHAMMYYSFEIKNDMHSSIRYYKKIEAAAGGTLQQIGGKITLPWISSNEWIDQNKLVQYGSCKIKEAQVVKDKDETLIALKQLELEEAKKSNLGSSSTSQSMTSQQLQQLHLKQIQGKIKPEFVSLAGFYLDQLCQYLQKSYQSESAVNANFSSNEEKIKEMWGKLQYCLCRCDTSTLIRISNHFFSIMTAFQSVQKQFYDNFILKKLEYEPLITEIFERFRWTFNGLNEIMKNNTFNSLIQLQTQLVPLLSEMLPIYSAEQDSKQIQNQLVKVELNLLRLMTNEFLYYHIIQNQFRFGDQLLYAYFSTLFYIEYFLSILRAKADDDLTVQLRSITKLVKQIDKLCAKNGDIFYRSYFKFLTLAYPPVLTLFSNQLLLIKSGEDEKQQTQRKRVSQLQYYRSVHYLNDGNDLLQMLTMLSNYFFDVKFNIKDLQKHLQTLLNENPEAYSSLKDLSGFENRGSNQNSATKKGTQDLNQRSGGKRTVSGADEEMKDATVNGGSGSNRKARADGNGNQQDEEEEEEEESEDEKKNYKLKMIHKFIQSPKIWNHIVSSSWISKTAPNVSGSQNQQLNFIYSQGIVDVHLLRDLMGFCQIMTNDRISMCGVMTKKDVAQMVTVLDIVAKNLIENTSRYYEKCSKAVQINNCFKEAVKNNPFRFQLKSDAPCQCLSSSQAGGSSKAQCLQDNAKQRSTVAYLLRTLINICSHLCIDSSPFQLVAQSNSGKRKVNLGDQLTSMNGSQTLLQQSSGRHQTPPGYIRFLQNLKRLSQLDTIYSLCSPDSLLSQAQIRADYFNLGNQAKLSIDYKEIESFKDVRLFRNIMNINLVVLSQLRQSLMSHQNSEQQRHQSQSWSNINQVKRVKICLTQMTGVLQSKLLGKKYTQKRGLSGATEKRELKIDNLKQQICALTLICEKLDKLSLGSQDPRFNSGNANNLNISVRELLDKLFSAIQQSNSGLNNEKMVFKLSPEHYEQLIVNINQVSPDGRQSVDASKWRISFDYSAVHSLLMRQLKIKQNLEEAQCLNMSKKEQYEQMSPIKRFQHLKDFSNYLQMAYNAQSLNGCIDCFIVLLSGGLELGLLLKYDPSLCTNIELKQLQSIFETVKKTLLNSSRHIFKFIHNRLIPLSASFKPNAQKYQDNQSDVQMSGNEDDERERSILLDDKVASSVVRAQCFSQVQDTDEMPVYDEFGSTLLAFYLFGDRLYYIMGLLQSHQWQKVNLQYRLVKALLSELEKSQNENLTQDMWIKLKDMMHPVILSLNSIEDNFISVGGMPNYYSDELPSSLILTQSASKSSLSMTKSGSKEDLIWFSTKNLLTQYRHNDFALAELRIKVREFYLMIVQETQQYETIKDMFKRQMNIQKQLENHQKNGQNLAMIGGQGGFSMQSLASNNPQTNQLNSCLAMIKSLEVQILFKIIKDKLVDTLYSSSTKQLERYFNMRNEIIGIQKMSQIRKLTPLEKSNYQNQVTDFKSIKDSQTATKENVPQYLKDTFELLIDTHLRKGSLNQKKLVDERQKRTIRQALIKYSAVSGPDNEIQSFLPPAGGNALINDNIVGGQGKSSSRFLDLDKLEDEEYESDALLICLKWYMNILEERQNAPTKDAPSGTRAPMGSKMDQDLYKKLKQTYEEIDKAIKEQQLKSQQDAIAFQSMAGMISGGAFMPSNVSLASKAFENSHQI